MNSREYDFDACALIIEDLRSEDLPVKLQAVSKLRSVAQTIGKERVKEELIPYLIETIEENNNEDEFLLQLTEQLGQISSMINKSDLYHFLPLLEMLVGLEEPAIRDKALATIKAISKGQDREYFSTYYLDMLKRLSVWEHDPSRIAACYLFASCYKFIPDDEKPEVRELYSNLMKDKTPKVRLAGVTNLGDIVGVMEAEIVKKEVIPTWTMLVRDKIDSVKIKAIESSKFLLPFYPKKEISSLLILLKNTDPEVKSWRVRYTLAETLASFCPSLDVDIVKRDVFQIFDNMLKDTEQEVKSCAILKLAEILDKLGDDQIQSRVVPALNSMITDTSLHVRMSVAGALSEMCKRLKPDAVIRQVLPLIQSLLKDEVIEVKSAGIKVLGSINEKLGKERIERDIFPLIQTIAQEKQWRCKLALVETLPEICKGVGYEVFKSKFLDFTFSFITDHYCLIREQTIENIKQLLVTYGQDKLMDKLKGTFQDLLGNKNYLFRMTALTMLTKLDKSIDDKGFQVLLEMAVSKLTSDKVANVRFVFIHTVVALKDRISSHYMKTKILPVIDRMDIDRDCDVAYFATDAMKKLKK